MVLLFIFLICRVEAQFAAAAVPTTISENFTIADTIELSSSDLFFLPLIDLNKSESDTSRIGWEYRLDGTGDVWKAVDQNVMRCGGVSPGEHLLQFRRKNAQDKHSDSISILLVVNQDYYRRTWFRAAIWVILGIVCSWFFLRRSENTLLRSHHLESSKESDTNSTVFTNNQFSADETLPEISFKDTEWLQHLNESVTASMAQGEISGEHLAAQMYISRSRLFHKVRHLTGMSLSQYIMEQRLQRARFLLEQKKCPTVKAVALSVGLKHINHFSKKYKERFGKLPSAYF